MAHSFLQIRIKNTSGATNKIRRRRNMKKDKARDKKNMGKGRNLTIAST
jgi:hypothetical protein